VGLDPKGIFVEKIMLWSGFAKSLILNRLEKGVKNFFQIVDFIHNFVDFVHKIYHFYHVPLQKNLKIFTKKRQ
jgi:hypothetical protein